MGYRPSTTRPVPEYDKGLFRQLTTQTVTTQNAVSLAYWSTLLQPAQGLARSGPETKRTRRRVWEECGPKEVSRVWWTKRFRGEMGVGRSGAVIGLPARRIWVGWYKTPMHKIYDEFLEVKTNSDFFSLGKVSIYGTNTYVTQITLSKIFARNMTWMSDEHI